MAQCSLQWLPKCGGNNKFTFYQILFVVWKNACHSFKIISKPEITQKPDCQLTVTRTRALTSTRLYCDWRAAGEDKAMSRNI
jgi:hypothetical protein